MYGKMQKLVHNSKFKKIMLSSFTLAITLCMCLVGAFAGTEGDMTPQQAATSIFSTLTEQISVGTIVGVIGIALGSGVGLYFAWWGIRKVVKMVKAGLNGKVSV